MDTKAMELLKSLEIIIFTDNHSKDGTENILQDLCKKNQKVGC